MNINIYMEVVTLTYYSVVSRIFTWGVVTHCSVVTYTAKVPLYNLFMKHLLEEALKITGTSTRNWCHPTINLVRHVGILKGCKGRFQ